MKPALMKGGGPYPGGGIPIVTGKVGGTKPTAPGTAWATGSWVREAQVHIKKMLGEKKNINKFHSFHICEALLITCTGIMVTCWLKVSV